MTFRALKREKAQTAQQEGGNAKSGKDPLDFGLYKTFAKEFLKLSGKEHTFAHCLFILCWNLMCRVTNGCTVCFNHMEWRNDALGIYFCHMKNDQLGERPKDPRHIYANPLMPEICPILAIGIYLMTHPIAENEPKLFPGDKQEERFRKIIINLMKNNDDVKKALGDRGMACEDVGTHSLRKGSATYCTSGTTSCPSNVAVHLRAGWALPGVQGTYMRYEAAGDHYAGRTVCGLPPTDPDFALLPPFFETRTSEIDGVIAECFPNLPPNLMRVAEFCLASVVYHREFLRATMHKDHPLFFTTLFRTNKVNSLAPLVVCRLGRPSDKITATGIPPHVTLLLKIKAMTDSVKDILPAIAEIPKQVVDEVNNALEERAVNAGTVTRDGLQEMITACLAQAGVQDMVANFRSNGSGATSNNNNAEQQPEEVAPLPTDEQRLKVFHYDEKFWLVPQGFQLPSGNGLLAWQYWCCGDPSRDWPPFRRLQASGIPKGEARKRFPDLKFLMKRIQDKVQDEGKWVPNPSIQQANEMYNVGVTVLYDNMPTSSPTKSKRRFHTEWSTMVNQLRKKLKSS